MVVGQHMTVQFSQQSWWDSTKFIQFKPFEGVQGSHAPPFGFELGVLIGLYYHEAISRYIYLFIYVSSYLSTYLPIYLSICVSIYLSICVSIYLSIYLPTNLPIYLFISISLSSLCASRHMSELKGFKAGLSWVGCWPWFWNLFRTLHPCHLQTSYLHGLSENRVPQKPLLCYHFPYQKNLLAGFTDVYLSFSAKSVLDPLSIQTSVLIDQMISNDIAPRWATSYTLLPVWSFQMLRWASLGP